MRKRKKERQRERERERERERSDRPIPECNNPDSMQWENTKVI